MQRFYFASIITVLGFGARETIRIRATALRVMAERSKPIIGATFIAVGAMLFFKVDWDTYGRHVAIYPASFHIACLTQ